MCFLKYSVVPQGSIQTQVNVISCTHETQMCQLFYEMYGFYDTVEIVLVLNPASFLTRIRSKKGSSAHRTFWPQI